MYNKTAKLIKEDKLVKKILSILLLMVMASASFLSGCDLVTLNEAKYYNTVVITVGDREFTKKDLLDRYYSVGTQYVEQGSSVEEALEQTVDSIISRELIITRAKEDLGELTQADKNDTWQEVYDYMNGELKSLEGQIKAEWGVVATPVEPEEEPEAGATYSPYEPTVEYIDTDNDGDKEFVIIASEADPVEEAIGGFVRENNNNGIDVDVYEDIQEEAYNRIIRQLKNNEEWKNLSTDSDEVFDREINRLYDIYEGNKYIENFQEAFDNNEIVNTQAVVDKYIEYVMESFSKYNSVIDPDLEAYHAAMSGDSKNVYYHPSEEYVYITHVLVKYTDEQKEELEGLRADLDSETIDRTYFDAEVDRINSEVTQVAKDEDGYEVGEAKTADQIMQEIETALTAIVDVDERARIFNEFIYRYGADQGMFNAEIPYIVNIDTEVTDAMIKPFADEARALHVLGEGSVSSTPVLGLVWDEETRQNNIDNGSSDAPNDSIFGYHIVFYSRVVDNIINYDSLSSLTPEALNNTLVYPGLSEQTWFHKIYDQVTYRDYANYQTSVINQLKATVEIVKYESRYDDLFKD